MPSCLHLLSWAQPISRVSAGNVVISPAPMSHCNPLFLGNEDSPPPNFELIYMSLAILLLLPEIKIVLFRVLEFLLCQ